MNVRTLCLAILYDKEASGYEIRKMSTEGEYSFFVEASYGSIYPALQRLESEGLVISHIETHEGRPAKKVYKITETGRETFRNTLFEPLNQDVFRSEFLFFARFASILPAELVERRLNERLADLDELIASFNKMLKECSRSEDQWLIRFGIEAHAKARDYIAQHKQELIAMAQSDPETSQAAE